MTLCAFPYYGGKTLYVNTITDLMPRHKRYVEAFGGGGSVLLNKPESDIEVFNDHDEHLVNFFHVLRTRYDELLHWLANALYSRADHEKWARQFYGAEGVPNDLDAVERAGRWFTLRHTQYGAIVKSVSGFSTPYKRNEARSMRANIDRFDQIRERFKHVVVECDDWLALLGRYDGPGTFWYFDPPYVGNEHEYQGEFNHAELVDALADLEGEWMVSYRKLPKGLRDLATHIEPFDAVDRADGVKEATEKLVLSYNPDETPMFRGMGQQTLDDAYADGGESNGE